MSDVVLGSEDIMANKIEFPSFPFGNLQFIITVLVFPRKTLDFNLSTRVGTV